VIWPRLDPPGSSLQRFCQPAGTPARASLELRLAVTPRLPGSTSGYHPCCPPSLRAGTWVSRSRVPSGRDRFQAVLKDCPPAPHPVYCRRPLDLRVALRRQKCSAVDLPGWWTSSLVGRPKTGLTSCPGAAALVSGVCVRTSGSCQSSTSRSGRCEGVSDPHRSPGGPLGPLAAAPKPPAAWLSVPSGLCHEPRAGQEARDEAQPVPSPLSQARPESSPRNREGFHIRNNQGPQSGSANDEFRRDDRGTGALPSPGLRPGSPVPHISEASPLSVSAVQKFRNAAEPGSWFPQCIPEPSCRRTRPPFFQLAGAVAARRVHGVCPSPGRWLA